VIHSDPALSVQHSLCCSGCCRCSTCSSIAALSTPAVDEARGVIRSNPALSFQHPYPPTKVGFIPDKASGNRDYQLIF